MRTPRSVRSAWRRLVAPLGVAALALSGGACSVADNLSADEILTEVDAIVDVEGSGRDLELKYRDRAEVSTWYMRMFLLQPLRLPLGFVFGRTGEASLEHPVRHVRELLAELPDEVGGDLLLGANAMIWMGWIAQLERNAHSRLIALDGMAAVARALELPLFAGDPTRFGAPDEPDALAAARASVQMARPDTRPAALRDEAALRPYAEGLARLTAAPLRHGVERLGLLEEIAGLYVAEDVRAIRPAVAAALRAALVHALEGMLAEIVADRDPDRVDLRLCAMGHVRALGGPRTVPLLLALMVASEADIARGAPRFDAHHLVQLRLIQYCGQLRGALADTAVRLQGRQGYPLLTPVEFLAITILNERDLYPKLRTPALMALTWSLQRPRLDPDPAWVREWRDQRR